MMKIMELITDAWNRAKKDVARPMECPFDYFGEGYLAAHLMQNVEVQRLTAELAACREAAIEECAKIAEKHGADDGGPSDTGSARVANVVREIRALKGQK